MTGRDRRTPVNFLHQAQAYAWRDAIAEPPPHGVLAGGVGLAAALIVVALAWLVLHSALDRSQAALDAAAQDARSEQIQRQALESRLSPQIAALGPATVVIAQARASGGATADRVAQIGDVATGVPNLWLDDVSDTNAGIPNANGGARSLDRVGLFESKLTAAGLGQIASSAQPVHGAHATVISFSTGATAP